ncbi:MAG: hypothetical protein ACR2KC_08310, partial [Acidimicrobiales bacterium]
MAGVRSAGGQGRGWGGVRVPASRRAAPDRALNLYKDRTGELSHDQFADALLVSEVLAREILGRQPAILSGGVPEGLVDEADDRWVVHQASGMIAAQLDVEVGEA